eukprot:3338718-Prymnesium_polylepis.2
MRVLPYAHARPYPRMDGSGPPGVSFNYSRVVGHGQRGHTDTQAVSQAVTQVGGGATVPPLYDTR